ncbi:MAG: MOSC domain-containing protein [Acidobacteriota bacterium]|nr:MOSC domain-containing protein [Acidobacteriota bacterium]
MHVATVSEILRYPVKSMAGESLSSVEIGTGGLPGDRSWAVRDEVSGGIRGAKRIAGLMQLGARFPEAPAPTGSSPAQILFPDGSVGATGDEDIAERVSKAVDHEVTLWPLLPPDALDHYRRGAPMHDDLDTELRAVFARLPDEPLPDVTTFPPEILEYESPPGTYFDAFPILILSRASLGTMQQRAPESVFDVRRFRPNIVLADTGVGADFPETEWAGRRIAIGEAVLVAELACPRCVMTTRGFADLPNDPKVMRALVQETDGNLGLYASVEKPGRVATGDTCELL